MLERKLGVQVFDRRCRGMILAEPGREVLRPAYRVFGELDDIRSVTAAEDTGLRGQPSVSPPPTVADLLTLIAACAHLRRDRDRRAQLCTSCGPDTGVPTCARHLGGERYLVGPAPQNDMSDACAVYLICLRCPCGIADRRASRLEDHELTDNLRTALGQLCLKFEGAPSQRHERDMIYQTDSSDDQPRDDQGLPRRLSSTRVSSSRPPTATRSSFGRRGMRWTCCPLHPRTWQHNDAGRLEFCESERCANGGDASTIARVRRITNPTTSGGHR